MKKIISKIANTTLLASLLTTSGVALAGNYGQQPQTTNNFGNETEIVTSPTISPNIQANPTATGTGTSTANVHTGDTSNRVQIGPQTAQASGGTVQGTIADHSQTLNNAGGAEVETSLTDNSQTLNHAGGAELNGTIADNSQTLNHAGGATLTDSSTTSNIAGGAEVETSLNGTIADNSQTHNHAGGATLVDGSTTSAVAGGAEVENALNADLSNGGVTGTIEDNSRTDNSSSSENELSQTNDQTNSQATSVDTSGSGNSENQNSQTTQVGGNNSSYTNNSVYKSGAAANIPQAAAIFATKSCVSSTSIGLGGGNVYAGYGGLSFSHVGSEAVSLVGTMDVDGEEVKVAYSIPELADLSPADRAPIFAELRSGEQDKATCLMSNYIAKERALTKAYDQATKVAEINAEAHIAGKSIDAQANMYIEEVRAKGAVDKAKTEAIGEAFNQTVKHACNLGVTVVNAGEGKQSVVKETLAIRGQGHENCEQVMWGTFNQLTDGKVKTTKPDFSQYTKGIKPAR